MTTNHQLGGTPHSRSLLVVADAVRGVVKSMNHEQTEAWIFDHAVHWQRGDVYVLPSEAIRELVRLAWNSGRNHGFQEGGKHVIEIFDATLGKGVAG